MRLASDGLAIGTAQNIVTSLENSSRWRPDEPIFILEFDLCGLTANWLAEATVPLQLTINEVRMTNKVLQKSAKALMTIV
jgi:hypothetical protein